MSNPFGYPGSFDDVPVWNPDGAVFEDGLADHSMREDFEERAERLVRKPFVGVQPVSVVPLRQGPWTSNNQLGIEQRFAPTANNSQTILKLDEWGFPEVWTVMLGLEFDTTLFNNSATDNFSVNALCNIGVGGTTQVVTMDWINGTTFSAPMNALNIIARYTNATGVPDDLKLRVTLGRGASLGNFPPQNTRGWQALTGNNSNTVEIPRFAKRFKLLTRTTTVADAALLFSSLNMINFHPANDSTGIVASLNAADALHYMADGVPIHRQARWLSFFNGSAVASMTGDFIFDLCL